jgi:dolichyl-phosphate-mannose-protein mannosyltransferase
MARVLGLIVIPLTLYLLWYSIHFAVLNRDDLGQTVMSPAFRATLIGNDPSNMLAGKCN